MSQISPPIRILLVSAVALMAAWMLFLRPKADTATPAAATPSAPASRPADAGGPKSTSLAGKAVEAANEATAAQDARAEELAGGAGETAAGSATTAPPAVAATVTRTGAPKDAGLPAKEALSAVPKPVRKALLDRKIVVLGVTSPKGIDDKLVRRQLRKVDTLHGRVSVHRVKVKDVSRYQAITRGVDLRQTPTIAIIGFDLKATVLVGWVDARTIDQAVVDSVRDSGELFTNDYLREWYRVCASTPLDVLDPQVRSASQYMTFIGGVESLLTKADRRIAALTPPARLRGLDRNARGDVAAMAGALAGFQGAVGSNPSLSTVVAKQGTYVSRYNAAAKRFRERMDDHDVLSCS